MLELIIIAVYFAGMIAVGLVSRRRVKATDDFFVAGRKGSTLFITGSLLATIIGGSATVGMAGLGFSRGLTGAWWLLVGSIGLVVLGFLFAKKVRQYALYTLPELVKEQYDSRPYFFQLVKRILNRRNQSWLMSLILPEEEETEEEEEEDVST